MAGENGPPPGAIQQPTIVAPNVISSTVLGLVSWWLGSQTSPVAVRDLVVRNFKADDIFTAWCKLRESCQLAAGVAVDAPIRHRTEVKLAEELVKDVSETEKNGSITLLVPSTELGLVRGRMDGNVGDDRPVASRLESLEDMMKGVVEKLTKMESNQVKAPQPQHVVQPPVVPGQQEQVGQQAEGYAAALASGLSFAHLLHKGPRRNSLSVKRSVSGVARDTSGRAEERQDEVFTDVVNRKKKKKEISTGTASLQSIPGVNVPLQASYQHFVGNTPGSINEDTLKVVFKELAVQIMEEKGLEGSLEIEQCNCLTEEQNTRTKVWRVVVPYKYKEVLQDDRLYPTGWHHKEFEGHYRPPLSPEERAAKEAKKTARQQNDNRLSALLRHMAGPNQPV